MAAVTKVEFPVEMTINYVKNDDSKPSSVSFSYVIRAPYGDVWLNAQETGATPKLADAARWDKRSDAYAALERLEEFGTFGYSVRRVKTKRVRKLDALREAARAFAEAHYEYIARWTAYCAVHKWTPSELNAQDAASDVLIDRSEAYKAYRPVKEAIDALLHARGAFESAAIEAYGKKA